MERPLANEYAAFYKGYIDQVPNEDIMAFLHTQKEKFVDFLKSLEGKDLSYRYAEGKWSVAEVVGHVLDTERVMAYRILRFSRNDKTPIPGFEQDDYVKNAHFNARSLASLVEEFESMRDSNLQLIKPLTEEQSMRTGEANGLILSVRALVYIIAGHLEHHWSLLRSKYLA